MATKWKKFSFSLPVRIFLNLLLIVSLTVGNISIQGFVSCEKQRRENCEFEYYSGDLIEDNAALQEEIKETLSKVLFYAGELSKIEDKKEWKKSEEEYKGLLSETEDKFKYYVYYKPEEDQPEAVFTNMEEVPGNLTGMGQKSILISYSGMREEQGYVKDWKNVYEGNTCDFQWLKVNQLINDNFYQSENGCFYIAKEIVSNIEHYRNNRDIQQALYRGVELGNISREIVNEIYWDTGVTIDEDGYAYESHGEYYEYDVNHYDENYNTEKHSTELDMDNSFDGETEKREIHLSEKQTEQLLRYIKKILYLKLEETRINIPISALLGTPASYRVVLNVDEEYVAKLQEEHQKNYERMLEYQNTVLPEEEKWELLLFNSCIAIFVTVLLLLCVCGRKCGTDQIQYIAVDRFSSEAIVVLFLLGMTGYFICFAIMEEWNGTGMYDGISFLVSMVLFSWLTLQFFFSIVRKWKGKILFRASLCGKLFAKVCVESKGLLEQWMSTGKRKRKIIILLAGSSLVCGVLVYGIAYSAMWADGIFCFIWALLLILIWGFIQLWWYRYLLTMDSIEKAINEVRNGKLAYNIPEPKKFIPLKEFVEDLNCLSDGLKHAASEMVKSERLKTELISNVSHDIKTPLTSIITYVDLLKKEELQPEKAKEYVDILEQKANRLKVLTDNLFEAAKASSGAMNTEFSEIDFGALIQQGIGEFSEKFEKNDLDVRNVIEEGKYIVYADGRLAWRILENVFTNVVKYALEGSRVYTDVKEEPEHFIFTVKNISAVELNISAEELMERFTRGERSRNTEGSGLGLNIAKSLAELQGGSFHVEIDGDLFKSVLVLPKPKVKERV